MKTSTDKNFYTKAQVLKATTDYFNGDSMAADVFARKYALKRSDTEFAELTPDDTHRRLAIALAVVESNPGYWEQVFYEQLKSYSKIVLQGSPTAALGNPYYKMTCSNCYVVPLKGDTLECVFTALYEMAKIQAFRGGVGIDLSPLRPMGSRVNNAAMKSTGAWSWADLYSRVTKMIGQSGREGALMLTLDVSHPDVYEFVKMKASRTVVTGANISVKLTDEFMMAVDKDEDFVLRYDFKNAEYPNIRQTIKARHLWDHIIEYATKTADPGLLMWDNIIRRSPADSYSSKGFKTICTNPCVSGDMRLLTTDGYKTIKELWELGGRQEYSGLGKDPIKKYGKLNIVNKNGIVPATNVYRTSENEKIYRVELENGQYVDATKHHRFILADGTRKDLCDLKVGDELPINEQCAFGNYHNPEYAETAGWIIGDGSLSNEKGQQRAIASFWEDDILDVMPRIKNNFSAIYTNNNKSTYQNPLYEGNTSTSTLDRFNNNKTTIRSSVVGRLLKNDGVIVGDKHRIPNSIWNGDKETVAAFLRGLFSADGSVQVNANKKSISIRLSQSDIELLQQCQILLNQFGIVSTIRLVREACKQLMNDGKGGKKEYSRKNNYDLILSGINNCVKFVDNISFIQNDKVEVATNWFSTHAGSNNSTVKFYKRIKSISEQGSVETFCLTEPIDNLMVINGISVCQCAELPLSAYDSCRLTSINLTGYVKDSFTKKASFNWKEFETSINVGIRMLDNMVDIDAPLQPFDAQRSAALNGRRLGLGTHGLADMLIRLGIKYDTEEGIAFIDKLYEFFKVTAYRASVDLAKERGPFPIFDYELEKDNEFLKELPSDLIEDMKKYGRRNISMLTCAPTGSISMMSQVSSGIEPIFRLWYSRNVKIQIGEKVADDEKIVIHENGDRFREHRVFHHMLEEYLSQFDPKDRNSAIESLPDCWVTSDKIDPSKRVRIQGALTKHLDHSASSTLNFPRNTPASVVGAVYMEAWKQGLKGITVYVEGSRDGILISDENKAAENKERPAELDAVAHTIGTNGSSSTVFIGFNNGKPYEVFCVPQKITGVSDGVTGKIVKSKDKKGSNVYNFVGGVQDEDGNWSLTIRKINKNEDNEASTFTRLISTLLRHDLIDEAIVQLTKSKGSIVGLGKAITRVLTQYVKSVKGMKCPECQSTNVKLAEGCMTCLDCGYSKCG